MLLNIFTHAKIKVFQMGMFYRFGFCCSTHTKSKVNACVKNTLVAPKSFILKNNIYLFLLQGAVLIGPLQMA
jgi:hypothetical protein